MNTQTVPKQAPGRVLVPTDFSEEAHAAVEYAASLCHELHSEVDLLHVWEGLDLEEVPNFVRYDLYWQSSVFLPPLTEPPRLELLAEFARTNAGHSMIDWLKELDQRDVESHGRVAFGNPSDPVDAIVGVARDEHYELIVMATHGRDRLLSYGVAERVVRRAPCPVITIRIGRE